MDQDAPVIQDFTYDEDEMGGGDTEATLRVVCGELAGRSPMRRQGQRRRPSVHGWHRWVRPQTQSLTPTPSRQVQV